MSVIGIDFGTQTCVIAQAKRGGVEVILNEASQRKTPTIVSLQQEERFLGAAAVPLVRTNCNNTVEYVKRVLGRKVNDPAVTSELPFISVKSQITEAENGAVGIKIRYGSDNLVLSPESIAAMVFTKLQTIVQNANQGRKGGDVVVSVPGYWTDAQRRAILNACEIAQVKCIGLINETTATALNYGIWKNVKGEFGEEKVYVLFVDVGYSNFSVSLVAFQKGKLEVIGTEYDRNLGGRNIDMALAQRFAEDFNKKYNQDVWTDPKAVIKLMTAVEKTKITLTPVGVPSANCNVECLKADRDLNVKISIDDFDALCEPIAARMDAPILKVLHRAGLSSAQLAAVEVVGGGSRVACVKRRIASVLGLDQSKFNYGLSMTMNADESVAMGAALACAALSPLMAVKPFEVVDTLYYPIRLTWDPAPTAAPLSSPVDMEVDEVGGGGADTLVLFRAGEQYPKARRVTFRRADSFQIVASYDSESKEVETIPAWDREIGRFQVAAAPLSGEELPRVRVNVRQNLNGMLSVLSAEYLEEKPAAAAAEGTPAAAPAAATAAASGEGGEAKAAGEGDAKEGEPAKKKFKRVNLSVSSTFPGLSAAKLTEAVELELNMGHKDRVIQETNDARNALEAHIYEARDAMSGLANYRTPQETAELAQALEELESWLYDDGQYSTKKVYIEKLAEHKAMANKYETRRSAEQGRPAASQALSQAVEGFLAFANSSEEKYEHITDAERQKVRDECASARGWLEDYQGRQGALNQFDDPVLTPQMISNRQKSLEAACNLITRKPKPKKEEPAPAPAPTASEPAKEAEKPAAEQGANTAGMDMD